MTKILLLSEYTYTHVHVHTCIDMYEMWNSVHVVLHKILFEKILLLLKIPVETSGLGFPRSSSALHLEVHTASPK